MIDAKYPGTWELPALGPVTPPTAVLIRPERHVAWGRLRIAAAPDPGGRRRGGGMSDEPYERRAASWPSSAENANERTRNHGRLSAAARTSLLTNRRLFCTVGDDEDEQ